MSREDGFAVMDVSTSVCDDPKWRRLAREHPEHVAVAFCAYVALMAESWRAGRRVNIGDSWPSILPLDIGAADPIAALRDVGLIDKTFRIPVKTWAAWFGPAAERRRRNRDRWARYNAQRDADTARLPRGSDAGTATSVRPSVPSVRTSRPARTNGADGAQEGHTKRGGEPVSLKDALVGYGLDERIAGKKP